MKSARNFIVRPFNFSDEDYFDALNIMNACTPDHLGSVAEWKARDASHDEKYVREYVMADLNGKAVGFGIYGHSIWTHQDGKYFIYGVVHSEYQTQGFGEAIYSYIIEKLDKQGDAKILTCKTREDKPQSIAFLEKRGFIPVIREPISRLDVTSFDETRFSPIFQHLEKENIQLKSVATLEKSDPNCWQKIYELDWLVTQDIPSPQPFTKPTFETFISEVADTQQGYHPDAFIIAIAPSKEDENGEYIGMSALRTNEANPTKLYNDVTGVLRAYRRMGIATALKVRTIQFARKYSALEIETDNEEINPMFHLNVALGFREVTSYIGYEKQLC